jgi:hypothetical protein
VNLALGRCDDAAPIVAALATEQPLNRHALALQATLWRLCGDARYAQWCDYAALVAPQTLDVPPGDTGRDAFLDELAAELTGLHTVKTHPLQQSARGGTQLHLQAPELQRPPVGALFRVLVTILHAYLARLGRGDDPPRSHNTGKALFSGTWSARLRRGAIALTTCIRMGGFHPPATSRCRRSSAAGPTRRTVPAGCASVDRAFPPRRRWTPTFAKRERGRLVLFPAYMWHGVEPFESDQPRRSVAFEVVPP